MFAQSQRAGFFDRFSNMFAGRRLKKAQLEELRSMLEKAVSDGVVTDTEMRQIDSFFANSELTSEQYDQLKNAVLNDVLASYCADRRVSPEEERSLKQIAVKLGFNNESLVVIDQHINFFSLMHHLETCPIEQLPTTTGTGLILQRGEVAHVSMPAVLMEERVVRREVVGRSHGVSVRIMKGVSYRVGQSRGQLVSETGIVPVASGEFTVTNKRLIFNGDRKSVNAPFNKVLSLDMFSDGFRLAVTNRQKPVYIQFFTTQAADLVALYISRILNH